MNLFSQLFEDKSDICIISVKFDNVYPYTYILKEYNSMCLPYFVPMQGHALAGGSVLALLCDYRIMAKGPYKIGVTEAQRVGGNLII